MFQMSRLTANAILSADAHVTSKEFRVNFNSQH